jgi:hypothetical protein
MKQTIRVLAFGIIAAMGVIFVPSSAKAWWFHRHRYPYYVPVMPVIAGGGTVGTRSVVTRGEAFFPTTFGTGEFFITPSIYSFGAGREVYYVTPPSNGGDGQRRTSGGSEAAIDAGKGGTPSPTPAVSSAVCDRLATRIDDLTKRVGALEEKVDRIDRYIQNSQAEREKADFAAALSQTITQKVTQEVLKALDAQMSANNRIIGEGLYQLSLPESSRDKAKLDEAIKRLKK